MLRAFGKLTKKDLDKDLARTKTSLRANPGKPPARLWKVGTIVLVPSVLLQIALVLSPAFQPWRNVVYPPITGPAILDTPVPSDIRAKSMPPAFSIINLTLSIHLLC
ncbi:hypothetical protein LXA43DRAFT_1100759 [Ganoderma leucocontextum]|nr:hypothetical protein LXA43DRAFT_1100759 [Ganoderma leucocontextum]